MRAVIMAGGQGARLRPLTENAPKPLARVCGRPVLEYIFDWLEENGICECVLALGCRAGEIREYCNSHPRALHISFSEEAQPLGTAGCVRTALDTCGSSQEEARAGSVLVLSGDALCNFPLRKVIQEHERSGRLVTLVTAQAGDPREYGLVLADDDGRVKGFVEKPAFPQALGEMVNTGIYVLSSRAVEQLPKQGDFAVDFFPELLRQGMPLYACAPKGYWCDIGSPEAYLRAQHDLLDGAGGMLAPGETPEGSYALRPPVWIGKGVRIGKGAIIGPWTVLDNDSAVGAGAEVSGSVLLPGAGLGSRAIARESILCAGSAIHEEARLSACTIGEKALVGKGARICSGVRIPGGGMVPEGKSVQAYGGLRAAFDDEGLCGLIGEELTPELAARAGCAIGSAASGPVGVCCAGTRACRVLADALAAGIRSAGVPVMDFNNAFEAMFYFGMRSNALELGVIIQGGERGAIRLLGRAGLPAVRALEREVEQRMAQGDFTRAKGVEFGNLMDLSGIGTLYATELLRLAPEGLEGLAACVVSPSQEVRRMLMDALESLGCKEDPAGVRLEVSRDGTRLAMSQGDVRLGCCRTVAAYGRFLFERGEDLAVGNDYPRALEQYAGKWGRCVERYLLCPADGSDTPGRMLAARQITRDGLMLAVLLLADLRRRGKTLGELDGEIPAFAVREADVVLTAPPARILDRLGGERQGEGILLQDDHRGVVLVRARKSGESLRLFAEAASWETAAELCADTAQKVKRMMGEECGGAEI